MNQRRGSNACTFLALYQAKAYHMNYQHIPSPLQISPVLTVIMMFSIMQGNVIHDTFIGERRINYSVEDAAVHLKHSLGTITTEESFDLTFINKNKNVPQSSVEFCLHRLRWLKAVFLHF